jgi:hypothetical protein
VNNVGETPFWHERGDLPGDWKRDPDPNRYAWIDPYGRRWTHVARRNVAGLGQHGRDNAMVIMRTLTHRRPGTLEGAAVRAVLQHTEWVTFNTLVLHVERLGAPDPVQFIARAVADKGALLHVLIRPGGWAR